MSETTAWEYRVETVGSTFSGPKDEDLGSLLNEWGIQGWEVFAASPIENSNKVRLVAKRPLTSAVRRQRTLPGT